MFGNVVHSRNCDELFRSQGYLRRAPATSYAPAIGSRQTLCDSVMFYVTQISEPQLIVMFTRNRLTPFSLLFFSPGINTKGKATDNDGKLTHPHAN